MARSEASPPNGWHLVPLMKIAEVRFSSVDKKSNPLERRVRLCNYTDVYNNESIHEGMPFMEATATEAEYLQFGLRSGDIVITKDSETPDDIGVPTIIREDIPNLVCGYHLALIRPDDRRVVSAFLARQLAHWRVAHHFTLFANGITRYGLPKSSVENAPIWLPDLVVQQRIADILDAADEAIRQTEAVIAKLKLMKDGLLHDLLTRGLDAHGRLRDPIAHPEQFKDSPLGQIPQHWDVVPVEQAGEVRLGRQRSPQHQTGRYSTRYLRVANVFDGYIDYSDVLEMDFTPAEKSIYELRPGDILLNEGQSIELVGRSAIYLGGEQSLCFQNTLVRFRCYEGNHPGYARAVFKYWLDTGRFMQIAKQTTSVAHLGADRFAKMNYPRPRESEQHRIADALDAIDTRIANEVAERDKLKLQKVGLMHDLLTGRVPLAVTEVAKRG